MFDINTRVIVLFAIGWFTLTNIACKKETPVEPRPEPPPLPTLTDPIPYEKMGQGKVVFERIGPYPGDYQGLYVIDINEQSSWGIDIGLEVSPVASPDGKKIASSKYAGYETAYDVHAMNIDGTNQQNISYIPGQDGIPSWMSDSKQILFYVYWYPSFPNVPLYKQSPVANPPDRVLIRNFESLDNVKGPFSVSPQGKLAFLANPGGPIRTGRPRICTMDIDGSDFVPVTSQPEVDKFLESPACSPDGQKIAYLSVVRDSTQLYHSIEIMLIDMDGSNQTSLAILEAYGTHDWSMPGSYGNAIFICWSPDGSKLLFNKAEGDFASHIYVINADGSGLTQITSAEGVTDICVSWSN